MVTLLFEALKLTIYLQCIQELMVMNVLPLTVEWKSVVCHQCVYLYPYRRPVVESQSIGPYLSEYTYLFFISLNSRFLVASSANCCCVCKVPVAAMTTPWGNEVAGRIWYAWTSPGWEKNRLSEITDFKQF